MNTSDNPLLYEGDRIPFHRIRAAHVEPGIRAVLAEGERRVEAIAADPEAPPFVVVTHHLEEVPTGVTHALLLRDGHAVAQGILDEALIFADDFERGGTSEWGL